MRRLRVENTLVLRTDRRALYLFAESQWIDVLVAFSVYRSIGLDMNHRGDPSPSSCCCSDGSQTKIRNY